MTSHKHLSNIDCLNMCTACLVCFISTVNGHRNKEKKKKTWKTGASSRHITIPKQTILDFGYMCDKPTEQVHFSITPQYGLKFIIGTKQLCWGKLIWAQIKKKCLTNWQMLADPKEYLSAEPLKNLLNFIIGTKQLCWRNLFCSIFSKIEHFASHLTAHD